MTCCFKLEVLKCSALKAFNFSYYINCRFENQNLNEDGVQLVEMNFILYLDVDVYCYKINHSSSVVDLNQKNMFLLIEKLF